MRVYFSKALLAVLFFWFFIEKVNAQNINGFVITVGKDAPAFLIFNDEITAVEFNATDGYKYYNIIKRSKNTVSIAYKREAKDMPPPQATIILEGKRTHSFQVVFDKNYDINKNPQLLYDYSDLKELKKSIAASKNASNGNTAQPSDEDLKAKAKEEEQQAALAKKKQAEEAERKKLAAAEAAKEEAQKKKQQEADIAKAQAEQKRLAEEKKKAEKEEAAEKERLAKQQREEDKKAEAERKRLESEEKQRLAAEQKAAQERKLEQDRIAAQKAKEEAARKEELKRITDEKERTEKERIAKQKADEARRQEEEAKKKEEARIAAEQKAAQERERIALQKQQEAERQRLAAQKKKEQDEERRRVALEKKRQEEEAAKQRLLQLEEDRKRMEEERKYSTVGLWERYGSKGINLYDVPEEQHELCNGDFYLTKDTLRNHQVSERLLAENAAPLLSIVSKPVKGVTVAVENIHFEGGNVYYTLLINNQSKDDFLQGAIGLYWYNKNDAPYKWLNCSYYTYINGYNLVKPGASRKIVFVTRLADVPEDESLLLVLQDRRKGSEKMSALISGKVYNQELRKTEVKQDAKSGNKPADAKRNKKKK